MGNELDSEIYSEDLAREFSLKFSGRNLKIIKFSSLTSTDVGSITFSKAELIQPISRGVAIVCKEGIAVPEGCCCLYSKNPRLTFAKIIAKYSKKNKRYQIASSAKISSHSKIGKNVNIGHNTVISSNVTVGDNCVIGHNVTIASNVRIGNNTHIKSNSVIGEKGFGFEYDEGVPVEFPQIGGVIIGTNVEIGALCTVASGTLDPTIINDYVKLDDHIHIAHNVTLGEASIITACAEFSGGVTTGKQVWVGPQAALMNKINIGDRALIGLGAVVTKDVAEATVVAGNPARKIKTINI